MYTEARWPLFICLIFFFLGTAYSIFTPIFEASDEVWHYPMVEHIATHWNLPEQPLEPGSSSGPWRQEASQPPLYYGIGALLTTWIDTRDMPQVRHLNPHVAAGEITPDGSNPNLVVHNPVLEHFPWRGTVLAIHITRIFSVLLGTWAVYLTWALVREIFPDPAWLAPIVAAVHAFTPMYLFISASVNNDNLIVPLCSLALLQMVRLVKSASQQVGESIFLPSSFFLPHFLLGVTVGLGLLTKASAIGLFPLVGATLCWETWQYYKVKNRKSNSAASISVKSQEAVNRSSFTLRHSLFSFLSSLSSLFPFFLLNTALILIPAFAISGWWFYRNYRLYGDWLGLNAFYAVLGTRDVAADLAQLWDERFAFAAGYWGNFGGLNIPFPGWVYTVLNTLAIVAFLGIFIQFLFWLTGKNQKSRIKNDKQIMAPSALPLHRSSTSQPPHSPTPLYPLWPFTWDSLTAARALAWAWPAAIFVSWIRWATITWSSQGRLIFSAIPLWSLMLILGLTWWLPQRAAQYRLTLALDLAGFLLGLSLTALPMQIIPAYTPPLPTTSPATTLLERRFGEVLRLHGYDIATTAPHPGETVTLTLYWEGLAPTATDHSIFIHVLGIGERIIAQRDTFPGRGLLSTTWLETGYTWSESYAIRLPRMAYTPDTLTFAVGVYETATGTRLTVYDNTDTPVGETVLFENLPLVAHDGDVPNPVDIHFGAGIMLRGYDLDTLTVHPGEQLKVTLYWEAIAPIPGDYTVSIQLLDTQWRKAAQSDAWPLEGAAPTSSWKEGQQLEEHRALTIAPDAAPSIYDLQLTLYRAAESGELEHLPIVWEKGQMPAKTVMLTRVKVE